MNGGAGKDLGRTGLAKALRQHGQDTEVSDGQPLLDYEAAAAYLGANTSLNRPGSRGHPVVWFPAVPVSPAWPLCTTAWTTGTAFTG